MKKRCTIWVCWVNNRERILSFHRADGFWRKLFYSETDFWAYVKQKVLDGYRVQ